MYFLQGRTKGTQCSQHTYSLLELSIVIYLTESTIFCFSFLNAIKKQVYLKPVIIVLLSNLKKIKCNKLLPLQLCFRATSINTSFICS